MINQEQNQNIWSWDEMFILILEIYFNGYRDGSIPMQFISELMSSLFRLIFHLQDILSR